MFIPRTLSSKLEASAKAVPVVAVVGPRQSGKSTLVRHSFPDKPYVTLEPLDIRELATQDPRGFLARFPNGAIIDEIQKAPGLFSYIQEWVDRDNRPGLFILTGSQHFLMIEKISQSLAGRILILELLPFSLAELPAEGDRESWDELAFRGHYPRLYDQPVSPGDWYPSYIQTYVERDVRQLLNVGDLETFQRFLRLCAGRTGQLLNYASLATDAGISPHTAKAWISVLKASFLVHLLPPHHQNFNKRLVKMPKLYFLDTGLACALLGITSADTLRNHPLRGAMFETWAVAEIFKQYAHQGKRPPLFFWRDKTGHEVDLLMDSGLKVLPVEMKSGQTFQPDMVQDLTYWRRLAQPPDPQAFLIFGGESMGVRDGISILGWRSIAGLAARD